MGGYVTPWNLVGHHWGLGMVAVVQGFVDREKIKTGTSEDVPHTSAIAQLHDRQPRSDERALLIFSTDLRKSRR
jgi:hypothetical protein